jgi:hypothetical protein
MKILLLFLKVAICVLFLSACVNIHSGFTYYKNKPSVALIKSKIKINGLYFIRDYSKHIDDYKLKIPTSLMYLYSDGSIYLSDIAGRTLDEILKNNIKSFFEYPFSIITL